MGAVERRAREKAEFREEVLAVARKIVVREGFGALSMRKIADEIEYAPGTIYLYFKSRDEIAQQLCQRGFEDLLQALAPAAAIHDPAKRLTDIGERYVRFGLEHPETYRLIFMEDPKFSTTIFEHEDADSPGMQALGFLIRDFDELKKQKRIDSKTDTTELAETIWAAMHGIVALKLTCHEFPQTPIETLTKMMTQALFRGVLKE